MHDATKRDRLEDLGIIYMMLKNAIDSFEDDYPFFDSKHQYEMFKKKFDQDPYEFHTKLRFLIDQIEEACYVAHGEK